LGLPSQLLCVKGIIEKRPGLQGIARTDEEKEPGNNVNPTENHRRAGVSKKE